MSLTANSFRTFSDISIINGVNQNATNKIMVEKSNDHETKKAEESKKIELVSTKQIPTEVLHDDEETKDEAAQAERERQRKAL